MFIIFEYLYYFSICINNNIRDDISSDFVTLMSAVGQC